MAYRVLCSLYKNILKKCKLKFSSMLLDIRKPGGDVQPRPLRKSPTRALVSDVVNLGNTFGKIIALVLARYLSAGL